MTEAARAQPAITPSEPGASEPDTPERTEPANDTVAHRSGEALPSRTYWANLNRPFAVGFGLTLGGLAAFVVGLAISNLSTVIIYVVFALFAALGLDPLVRRLERAGMPRPWGIVL